MATKKKEKNYLSPEQDALFDEAMAMSQAMLSLGDWRIERGSGKADKGAMAEVFLAGDDSRLAVYRTGEFGPVQIRDETIIATALHECLHVMLYDLIDVARNHARSEEDVRTEEHRVVNRFESLLTPMLMEALEYGEEKQ